MLKYLKVFIKWILLATLVGLVGGVIGYAFHESIDIATHFREENRWIIYFLPVGGLIIAGIYRIFKSLGSFSTNRVIEAVQSEEKVPLVMSPLIFVSTVLTHLLGGSAGREGAALQLGGSLGYNIGKWVRLSKSDLHIIVMAGMSAVFSALFGTPLTAAIFAVEVCMVGAVHYSALFPSVMSAVVAFKMSTSFGAVPISYDIFQSVSITPELLIKVIALAVLCALVCILFCESIKRCEHLVEKYIKNSFVRIFAGGAVILILTLIIGNQDYNGAGMHVITDAMNGNAKPYAFILKIVFTAITISVGFRGGEIVPAFFVGSTFGCVLAQILGLDAGFGASIGFVALFCGAVNCPIASIMLALEVFGTNNILIYALVCCVSFMMSGNFGLYKSQKLLYSKLYDEYKEVNAK